MRRVIAVLIVLGIIALHFTGVLHAQAPTKQESKQVRALHGFVKKNGLDFRCGDPKMADAVVLKIFRPPTTPSGWHLVYSVSPNSPNIFHIRGKQNGDPDLCGSSSLSWTVSQREVESHNPVGIPSIDTLIRKALWYGNGQRKTR